MSSRLGRGCLIVILATILLLACSCVAIYLALSPSASCRSPDTGPAQPGSAARTLVSGGQERCYRMYVPASYDASQPLPLVISLHGFASKPEGQERTTGWNVLADQEGFVVVSPQGTGFPLRWNADPVFQAGTVDDVQFISDVIADVSEIAAIDPARIYVSGMSNGGAMANRVGCELADQVAAIGTVAAVPLDMPNGCTPSRPIPLLAFHGTSDPLVRYEGSAAHAPAVRQAMALSSAPLEHLPVETWIEGWAERNGCEDTPEAIPPTGDASGIRYTGCKEGVEVTLFTIDGGGHTWPGGPPIPFLGKTSQDIDATAALWAFFKAHPLEGDQDR
jgi:polyhydroxybutyrate depolymerase